MTNDKGAKKTKVDSNIEKLEERIAPGGIGGLVGDLSVEPSTGYETISRDEDIPSSISPERMTPLETISLGASPQGGEGDLPANDGSDSKTYVDSVTETSDGQGGGAWDDRQGNTQNWNVDGSGSWSSSDGSRGYQNADGSGGYSNTDGSYGSYVSDGSSSHTESNGVAYQQSADGSGFVTYPDGIGDTGEVSSSPMAEDSDGTKQTESDTRTYEDGTVETWNQDGSGSAVYVDGTTETWDGHGGGTWDNGAGNSHTWNDDGSGTWVDPDGRSGYQNANGTGGYNNADGSYGTYNEDGSGTHTETDGARWIFNSDGSGNATFLDGTTKSWGSPEGSSQDESVGGNGQEEDSHQEAIQESTAGEYGHTDEEGLSDLATVSTTEPPDPNSYVNEFILPLFEGGTEPAEWGLDYDSGGPVSWTLPIDMADVDLTNSSFVISGDLVGVWEGGVPPEASGPDEFGSYRIQCWEIVEVIDNGDRTVTLIFT